MKTLECHNCGSTDLKKEGSYWVCQHCGSKNYFTEDELPAKESEIAISDDVALLLKKWERDPSNANKYARLILQLDPHNSKALAQLKSKQSGGCYIATAVYGSYDCPQVWTLRRYRDDSLSATWYGRAFIKVYYATSPTLVKLFGDADWFKNTWKKWLDQMVFKLKNEGVEDTPYEDKNW